MFDSTGLSILIPIYNYAVQELVNALCHQAKTLSIPYEILCYDDCSSIKELRKENQRIADLPGVIYKELPENIGRSKIRNKLAKESTYQTLLFIDCDSKIIDPGYLKKYLELSPANPVIAGGTVYTQKFDPEFSLRLKYGKEREQQPAMKRRKFPYRYINLNNLVVQKQIYLTNPLDESISTYGHEDTKFGYFLKEKNIKVIHIDNPVDHCGLENNEVFLQKTQEGIKNFLKISFEGYGRDTKLYKSYALIHQYKLDPLFFLFYHLIHSRIEKNLRSSNPSLFYFDLLKLKTLLEYKNNLR